MTLDDLAEAAHDVKPDQAAKAATLRLDDEEDVAGVIAFFGKDMKRGVVRLVIRGEEAGYLERGDVLKWLKPRMLGWGDSSRSEVPGHLTPGAWRLTELECPVAGCEQSPVYVARYDESAPPHCALHPDEELRPQP